MVPAAQFGDVFRHRLLAYGGAHERVVAFHAPAGYGKTTLATQWCRQDRRPTSWLTLRPGDADPILLLSRLSSALEAIEPLDPEYDEILRTFGVSLEWTVDRLLDRLERYPPFQLALDEVDRVTGKESQDVLNALVNSMPHDSQMVLASRAESVLPLARLHVSGDIRELRAPDLAFTVEEIAELFRQGGLAVTDHAIATLHEETEGWPAAIGLVFSAARTSGQQVQECALPLRELAGYLREEVLAQEDAAIRCFMLQTSFLPRLSAPLCDAVTLRHDSSRILADLEDRNLFVRSLDEGARWFRYHDLWKRFLRSELEHSGHNLIELRDRAAAWHEAHGDAGQSFRMACQTGDLERAGRVLLQRCDEYVSRGLIGSLRSWLRRCPEDGIEADPQLAIAGGWISMLSGDFERSSRYLAAAQRHNLDRPSADGSSSLRAAMINLRAALGLGGADQILADGLSVIGSEGPRHTRSLPGGYRATGTAHLVLGQDLEAVADFEEVLFLTADHMDDRHSRVFSLGCLALAQADLGHWEQAESCVRNAEQESAPFLGLLTLPLVVAQAALQDHLTPRAENVPMLLAAVEATEAARAVPWLEAEMALRCSRLAQRAGNRKLARRALANARQACLHMEEPGILLRRAQNQQSLLLHGDSAVGLLTPAERRVLEQLETHRTLKEIGEHLYISRATVKTHVSSIYAKLNVAGRNEAVAWLQD
jgi:LuxR family transcriptional regulator, maltose regulon positive regulatory protein